MPLVFNPLSEDVLSKAPRKLSPKCAFLMRQLGNPPASDLEMTKIVKKTFSKRGIKCVDAGDTAGQNDFLERIIGLIRSTAFTVAIFSEDTRAESLANIMLELGFAAMCGKPLVIAKSLKSKAPSDLTRTDWIVYDPANPDDFRRGLNKAIDEILALVDYESMQIDVSLNAPAIDCATAFEKANKAFLLSGDQKFVDAASKIFNRIGSLPVIANVSDLERIRQEIDFFIRQAEAAIKIGLSRRERNHRPAIGFGSSAAAKVVA